MGIKSFSGLNNNGIRPCPESHDNGIALHSKL